MKRKAFNRGDIILVSLNPVIGKELQGDFRPCLILSPFKFNQLGMTLVAPITQGGNLARIKGFTVSLSGAGTMTQGVVLVNNVRMLDLTARKTKKVEKVPDFIINEVIARLSAIIED